MEPRARTFWDRLRGRDSTAQRPGNDLDELRAALDAETQRRIEVERRDAVKFLYGIAVTIVVGVLGVVVTWLIAMESTRATVEAIYVASENEISSIESSADLNQLRGQLGDCHRMGLIGGDAWNRINGQLDDISKADPAQRSDPLREARATAMTDCPNVSMCVFDPDQPIAARTEHGVFPICDPMLDADFEDWSVESGFVTIPPGG